MSVVLTNMDMPNSCYECKLKTCCDYTTDGRFMNKRDENCPLIDIVMTIKKRKTIKERKGKWIRVNPFVDTLECSECGWQVCTEELCTPYCPWCGAKMEE